MSLTETETSRCVNHPKRTTSLRCGKCGNYICTKCMVYTPVGVRCRSCAQLRRLPQFDVGWWLLLRSGLAGLIVSVVVWFLISPVPYLRYFLSILVGLAVGETVSRLAKRRTSRLLEVLAVVDIIIGLAFVEMVRITGGVASFIALVSNHPSYFIGLVLPAAIASFVAVVKLR